MKYIRIYPLGGVWGKRLNGDKLSNSRNFLKLIVPSNSWKTICGWFNYSGKVTSYKIGENQMDYHGSKSNLFTAKHFVKDQLLNGSLFINRFMNLRHNLMSSERNYQIKVPSCLRPCVLCAQGEQLRVVACGLYFSTLNSSCLHQCDKGVNSWFWSGLIDGEGSFTIVISKNKNRKLGWRIEPNFQIGLDIRDHYLLLKLQQYLGGVGFIYVYPDKNRVIYSINSKKDLTLLISHLEKYPLIN